MPVGLPPSTRLSCPECQTPECTIKDRRERTWRHLDTCQHKTLVTAPLPPTDCPFCAVKTITPPRHRREGPWSGRMVMTQLTVLTVLTWLTNGVMGSSRAWLGR